MTLRLISVAESGHSFRGTKPHFLCVKLFQPPFEDIRDISPLDIDPAIRAIPIGSNQPRCLKHVKVLSDAPTRDRQSSSDFVYRNSGIFINRHENVPPICIRDCMKRRAVSQGFGLVCLSANIHHENLLAYPHALIAAVSRSTRKEPAAAPA
jgi:hypothetical protein